MRLSHPSLNAEYAPGTAPIGGLISPIAAWDHAQTIAAAQRAIESFRSSGVRVPIQNRIQSSVDFLERAHRFHVEPNPSDPETEDAFAESRRIIFEMHTIAARLSTTLSNEAILAIEGMLKGRFLPLKGSFDNPRDTQAEFFAASLFGAAGYSVERAEPDLVIRRDREPRLGVAVKRVTGDDMYRKRVKKAQQQLENQNLHGYIVVNAQRFLSDTYRRDPSGDISAALFRKVSSWVNYLKPRPGLRVLAVVGIGTSFRSQRAAEGFNMSSLLHFHPIFVAMPEEVERLAYVDASIRGMAESVRRALVSMHQV